MGGFRYYNQTSENKYEAEKWRQRHDPAVNRIAVLLESIGMDVTKEYPLPAVLIEHLGERNYTLDLVAAKHVMPKDKFQRYLMIHPYYKKLDTLIVVELDGGYHYRSYAQKKKGELRDNVIRQILNTNRIYHFDVEDVYDTSYGYTDNQLLSKMGLTQAAKDYYTERKNNLLYQKKMDFDNNNNDNNINI